MGRLPTTPSNKTPSPSEDEIVELRPPAEYGFGGTVKCYRGDPTMALLQAKGYRVVDDQA